MTKINEKTMELNVTNELLNLCNSFWWFLKPIALKKYWRPVWRFPTLGLPRYYPVGLDTKSEGANKTTGGWDIKIQMKKVDGYTPRALFMQFKAGKHYGYCQNKESLFHGNRWVPNPHIGFPINSTNNKDQHEILRNLAKNCPNDAVLYVLPRISSKEQLEENLGNLIKATSFISIADIDKIAAECTPKVDLGDGESHKFRMDYHQPGRRELNYFYFAFEGPDHQSDLISEIVAIRIEQALTKLKFGLEGDAIPNRFLREAMTSYWFFVAEFFGNKVVLQEDFSYDDLLSGVFESQLLLTDLRQGLSLLVIKIFSKMRPFMEIFREGGSLNAETRIPKAPTKFSVIIPDNGLNFSLPSGLEGGFNYQLI